MNRLIVLLLMYFFLTGQSCQKDEILEIQQPLASSSIHFVPLYSDKDEHSIVDFNIHNSENQPIVLKEVLMNLEGT
ncbi:MAG: hypothetical protein WAT46_07880, partial [Saprospiraceae bacterium]